MLKGPVVKSNSKSIFAKKLRIARKRSDLSQSELSEKLSKNWQTVSRWERGVRLPSADELDQISTIFCRPLHWFFEETDSLNHEESVPLLERVERMQNDLIALKKAIKDSL